MDNWSNLNPFSDNFVRQEVDFYGHQEYDHQGVQVTMVNPSGRLDDYLNTNFRTGGLNFPRLCVGKTLWMSLSPMEAQSHFLPILFAEGEVGVGGLGLGYYTLRVMAKGEVDRVTVFEQDPKVIEYFKTRFGSREGFSKVRFVEGDARETMKGYDFSFVFMDIYPTLCGDDMVEDIALFNGANDIDIYHPWGREKILLEASMCRRARRVDRHTQRYFQAWAQTPARPEEPDMTLPQYFRRTLDEDYIEEYLELAYEYCIEG